MPTAAGVKPAPFFRQGVAKTAGSVGGPSTTCAAPPPEDVNHVISDHRCSTLQDVNHEPSSIDQPDGRHTTPLRPPRRHRNALWLGVRVCMA
jgi:hypothetical protein